MRSHSGDISGSDDGEVKILSKMMGYAVGAVGQALVCRFPYIK